MNILTRRRNSRASWAALVCAGAASGCAGTQTPLPSPPPALVDHTGAVWYQWQASATEYAGANAIRLRPGLWLATDHAKPRSGVMLWSGDVLDEFDPKVVPSTVDPVPDDRPRSVNAADWILVRTDEDADAPVARIAWGERPEVGERVWVFGGGFGRQISSDRGWLEVEARAYPGVVRRAPGWSIAPDEREALLVFTVSGSGSFDGLSGSPVVNEKGEVVAMHLGRMGRRLAWFDLDTVYVARLLDKEIRQAAELP